MKNIHIVHEGHIDYNCESCGKSFSCRIFDKTHVQCSCESCCKSFTQVQHLKRHSTQFMKATNISNVKYVTYHLVHQECKTIENPDQKVHKCDIC